MLIFWNGLTPIGGGHRFVQNVVQASALSAFYLLYLSLLYLNKFTILDLVDPDLRIL